MHCKLLSCRSKQICLIVKTLTNIYTPDLSQVSQATTWPNISLSNCHGIEPGLSGKYDGVWWCDGMMNNVPAALSWTAVQTCWSYFSVIGSNLWPKIPRSKKCVEEVKTWVINPRWNSFSWIFVSEQLIYIWFRALGKILICIFIKCKYLWFLPRCRFLTDYCGSWIVCIK